MHKKTSLPIKLAQVRDDLEQILQTETEGTAHWGLVNRAYETIDRIIREFELEGRRLWINVPPDEEVSSD